MEQLKIEFLYEHPVHKGYACDEEGNVYSLNYNRTGKVRKLKPGKSKDGYLHFGIFKDGKQVSRPRVHRFVWECIIGEIPDGYDVDHLGFDRQNNRIENLKAIPASENRARKSEEGKKRQAEATKKANSQPVLQLDKQGNLIAEFPSAREAERQTGVGNTHISECCKGKLRKTGGFIWRYAS